VEEPGEGDRDGGSQAMGMLARVSEESRASTPVSGVAWRAVARLRPASVAEPVATTTATARPAETVVPS
jgi:hypothetical protein